MYKNINVYLRQEGILSVFNKTINRLLKVIGLKKSVTILYLSDILNNDRTIDINLNPSIKMQWLNDANKENFYKLEFYDFEKPYDWIQKGSRAILAIYNGTIIGRSWIHFPPDHEITGLGVWKLDDDEVWMGPTYVAMKYRKKGVQKMMACERLKYARNNGYKYAYTSVSADNIPSIAMVNKFRYKKIGEIKIRNILGKRLKIDQIDTGGFNLVKIKFNHFN